MGELYSGGRKRKAHVCPGWRVLAGEAGSGHTRASSEIGLGYVFAFLGLLLSGSQGA